jgi:hypothetical protein
MQIDKRHTSQMHEAPDKEMVNTHRWCLRQKDQTAQHSAAQVANNDSQDLRREDQTTWFMAIAIKISSQVSPASPALLITSLVTRSQGNNSAEALMPSDATGDPFTDTEAME